MSLNFERSSLWQRTLTQREDEHSQLRDDLRSEFLSFRGRIAGLVGRITVQLPGLTIHDITHLDHLWETASLIAGNQYPLNPLEAFVLGGAFLLHDAALCFEAYEGGAAAVRETVAWKDAFADETDSRPTSPIMEREAAADFLAIRNLHAKQAERLVEHGWTDPDTKEKVFLISDLSLRKHLGPLIGRIAASHHWSIEEVSSALRAQFNAPGEYPREWRVSPTKIACIVRCADAIHIDQTRAPDFLHALLRRRGISFLHWCAQNWLAPADLDVGDPSRSTIIITSTRAFKEENVDSWWVAYDAIEVANREIQDSNALLDSANQRENAPSFQVKRIKGAGHAELLAQHVETEGWSPCSATIHVSNIEKVVKTLGGEHLYPDQANRLAIALRELIQNSRDAIRARGELENDFLGSITVRLHAEDSHWIITVEDDGIGMSERVLLGPLLDFGNSFWASSLVQTEFPGLRSSKFRPVGRFGVGFFSIFMVADAVTVSSRRFDEGLEKTNQLVFKDGVTLRPILRKGRLISHGSQVSTKIVLRLKPDVLSSNATAKMNSPYHGAKSFEVPLYDYLCAIVAGLDVNLYFVNLNTGNRQEVHTPQPISEAERESWLRHISFSDYQPDGDTAKSIPSIVPRLRPIMENGICYGLAAISTRQNPMRLLGRLTVGGLTANVHQGSEDFSGFIDSKTKTARREASREFTASPLAMKLWADEQLTLLENAQLTDAERCTVAYSLASFGVDPVNAARAVVVHEGKELILSFRDIATLSERVDVAILKSSFGDHAETHHHIFGLRGFALVRTQGLGKFAELKFVDGVPAEDCSIIGCIHRSIVTLGRTPTWRVIENAAPSFFGMMSAVAVRSAL